MIKILNKQKKTPTKKQNLRNKVIEKRVKDFLTGNDFADYIIYLKSNRKIMLSNFLAGIFRGLGFIIGVTVVFAVLVWFLSALHDFPIIGGYAKETGTMLKEYAEETKYKDNFENIEKLLEQNNIKLEKLIEIKSLNKE